MRQSGLAQAGQLLAVVAVDLPRQVRLGIADLLEQEQDRWFLWLPAIMAFGVAAYFGLPREPWLSAIAVPFAGLFAAAWLARPRFVPFIALSVCTAFAGGMLLAKVRSDLSEAPRLWRDLNGVFIKGWVEEAEMRGEGRLRLRLRVHSVSRLRAQDTPARVLVSLRGSCKDELCRPGAAIELLAFLRPLPGPVMPGGHDYAREAYFEQIGATGFAPRAPEAWREAPAAGMGLRLTAAIERLRQDMTGRIVATLPGDRGAIAAALLTGVRGGISEEPLNALRMSGLAHVLSISGLHMSLMAGTLFWVLRALLALSQAAALRLPVKKTAAAMALCGATAYLALSGASIATQRAYVMIAIMFIAILCGRPALTMRNLAIAALVVIVLRPESILSVSFQMSFAATLGLIAAYERKPGQKEATAYGSGRLWPVRKALLYVAALCMTTVVASAATAPFAAYHFSRLAPFSLLGNLLAMPLVSAIVMPAGLAALVLLPLGLEALPLSLMGWGLGLMLDAARFVATLPGADTHVARMPLASLLLIVFGCLWLVLWRRRWRFLAVIPVLAAVPVAYADKPPDILIDARGRAIAVRQVESGKLDVLDPSRSQFSASRWLAADGDERATGNVKAERFACDAAACISHLPGGGTIAIVRHRAALAEECANARIVVVAFPLNGKCTGPELILDAEQLRIGGSHALWTAGLHTVVRSARPDEGARPWWPQPPARQQDKVEPDGED